MLKKKNIIFTKYKIKKKQYSGNPKNIMCSYFFKSLINFKISECEKKAINFFIQKFYKKKSYFLYKLFSPKIITFKSKGFRMGKGKGSKKKKIYLISQGNIFLELESSKVRNKKDFILFKTLLQKKMSIKIQTFYKKSFFLSL